MSLVFSKEIADQVRHGRTRHSPDCGRETSDAFCPSCERFIGPKDTCPYCDADSSRAPAWRIMRRFALLLALAGVVCLHLAMRHKEPPLVAVADIGPAMNFGWVRIQGSVVRKPSLVWEGEKVSYLSFSLKDGSNYIRVAASGDVAAELDESGLLPAAGTAVQAGGTLEFDRENRFRLRLHSPAHLQPVSSPSVGDQSPAATGAKGDMR